MAVQLGVNAAGVVGDEGKLGIDGPGGGEGDPAQSVSHQERLQTKRRKISDLKTHSRQSDGAESIDYQTHSFILIVQFHPLDGELDGHGPPPPARLIEDNIQ